MLELLILSGLGLWLALALRSCRRRGGGCSGDCTRCSRGCREEPPKGPTVRFL